MDRVLTIPNAISALRLAGVPVFLWLVLGPRTATADAWAVAVLIIAGLSDWLDGKLARALNQGSRLKVHLPGPGSQPLLLIFHTVLATEIQNKKGIDWRWLERAHPLQKDLQQRLQHRLRCRLPDPLHHGTRPRYRLL